MSIYVKTLWERRAALAALLISGGLISIGSLPSSAQTAVPVGGATPGGGQGLVGPVGTVGTVGIGIQKMVTISGHVPALVKRSTPLGALPSAQTLSFAVSLPVRNQAALADLLQGLNDPSDSRYGQYLTPEQFGAQFGATQMQYNTLIAYLQSKGLTVTQAWSARTYLTVSGTAAQVNSAFGVTLKQFQSPEGNVFYAPDTEVRVPSTVSALIAGVVGLDNANPPKPLLHVFHHAAAPAKSLRVFGPADAGPTPNVQNPGEQGTGPQGGFGPSDFRQAYGLSNAAQNGAGQSTAIIEYGTTFNIKDIVKYEQYFGLPRVPITIVPVDGGSTTYQRNGAIETVLDIDMHLAMAPGAKQILVYLGSNNGSILDAINQVYADQSNTARAPKQLSISYGFGAESGTTPSSTQVALETSYAQLASAGVSVYVSSGDSGSTADGSTTSVDISSSEPMVCSVGGTALTVQSPGANENYKAESTWNYDGTTTHGAGGGGVSQEWTIAGNGTYAGATYQANAASFASQISGSNVSATMRNVPDISCDASPQTGAALYVSGDPALSGNYGWIIVGGTSEAAPLWAGYTALINQSRVQAGLSALGLPQNSLYPLAYSSSGLTSNYATLFHDIADGSSNKTVSGGTNYAAVTGYDCSTGLGTMQGMNLIAALSTPNGHVGFSSRLGLRYSNGTALHLAEYVLPASQPLSARLR